MKYARISADIVQAGLYINITTVTKAKMYNLIGDDLYQTLFRISEPE